jgi:3-hydroxyisobutyrate dehydrogenase
VSRNSAVRPPARVTVVGLGNMGRPMAACLARAGYQVTGFDIVPAARERFAGEGGHAANDAGAAVADAEVVITLLPDGKAVRDAIAMLRPHLKPGAILIDMSSSAPLGTRALGEELIAAGFGFIDAPVSGGVKRAIDGTLAIMVGGAADTIEHAEPVLAAMGKTIFRTGRLGSGHAMKALNNYVSAAGLVAAVEALAIGAQFGLEPAIMVDVLNASTGRNNSTENKLKQFVIPATFNTGFSLALMAKDIRTANELAHALGVTTPLADEITRLWSSAEQTASSGADHTEIGRFLAAPS